MLVALFNHRINDESAKNKKKYMCPHCVNADLLRTGGCANDVCVCGVSSLVDPRRCSFITVLMMGMELRMETCSQLPTHSLNCSLTHSLPQSSSGPRAHDLISSTFSSTRARGSQGLGVLHGRHEAEERQHVLRVGDTP